LWCSYLLFSFGFDAQKKIIEGLFSLRESSKRNLREWEKLRRQEEITPMNLGFVKNFLEEENKP